MTIEEALKAYAEDDATTAALVGTRIHPIRAPQGTARPFAAYRCNGDSTEQSDAIGEGGDLHEWRGEYECRGDTYTSAKALASALRGAFHGYSEADGAMSGVDVQCIWCGETTDMPFDQDTKTYGVLMPLTVWYRA